MKSIWHVLNVCINYAHIYLHFTTGAVTAIHDAIALANVLYAMPSKSSSDITKAFEEYRSERYPAAKEAFENSQLMSKITDRSLIGAVIFYLYTNMPMWLWRMMVCILCQVFIAADSDSKFVGGGTGIVANNIFFSLNFFFGYQLVKLVRFRPQAGFLKALEVKGSVVPVPSPSEKKARAIFEKQSDATFA